MATKHEQEVIELLRSIESGIWAIQGDLSTLAEDVAPPKKTPKTSKQGPFGNVESSLGW